MHPSATVSVFRAALNQAALNQAAALNQPAPGDAPTSRAAANRANARHSTGPRTAHGKHRSSQNALRHGLTARTAVLPSEDLAAYRQHVKQFLDEYKPATATEDHLVHELAHTSWRLNRIPLLEADLLANLGVNEKPQAVIQSLASLGLHGARLSRQFQKALDQLRDLQDERRRRERRRLREAAEFFVLHQHKGTEWDPAADGFVFSKDEIERHANFLMRHREAISIGCARFDAQPGLAKAAGWWA